MSVRKAARLAVAFGAALVAVFAVFLLREGGAATSAVREVQQTYEPSAAQSALLTTSVSDMQRGVTSFVLTGIDADLRPYVDGARRSDLALEQLAPLLAHDPQLSDLVRRIRVDRERWIAEAAEPTIDARRADGLEAASGLLYSARSDELYLNLQADTSTLQALLGERSSEAFAALTDRTYRLLQTVIISVSLLIIGLGGFTFLTRRKLLEPLDELRLQIRSVARESDHTHTIEATGPQELRELGTDVEALRRQLVSEIDEARSARQALDQKAPAVAAIRAELAASGAGVEVPGLQIAGSLQPAEGVLAGDWWDTAVLPTGEVGVIVADISGHGAEAGIAAMRLKHAIGHDLSAGLDVEAVARGAAEVFQRHPDRFATVAAVFVNPETGEVRYINAGHHEPLVIDDRGLVRARLRATGPILSWLGGGWAVGRAELRPGQTLLLYSDGLLESHDAAGDELGDAALEAMLAEVPDDQRSAADLVPWLLGAARQRAVDWDRDDVTVVAITRPDGWRGDSIATKLGTEPPRDETRDRSMLRTEHPATRPREELP